MVSQLQDMHSFKHPAWVLSHSPPCILSSTTNFDFPDSRKGGEFLIPNTKAPLPSLQALVPGFGQTRMYEDDAGSLVSREPS